MVVKKIGTPNRKQRRFLKATKKHVGFGGARGGGKSWGVRAKAKVLATGYPGIKQLIVRRTYPELINNHINVLKSELVPDVATYKDKEKVLNFKNGSSIHFMYCNHDKDLDRLQGCEYDIIYLDEATQLSEYQMQTIVACCRGANDFPKRIYYTCNPGGQGHGYIKRIFIDRKFTEDEDPDDYEFIQSLVTDNEVLMKAQPDYVKQLKALPEKLRKAWLDGQWDIFEGQFFEDFIDRPENYESRKFTHVIKPFEINHQWKIYRSFDWGYAKPFSCGWWAVDFDGVVYRILELYGCTNEPNTGVKWTPPKVFAEIARIEREHPWLKGKHIRGIADPAIWDAESGVSIAEVAEKHGVFFEKADNKRIPGWMQVHYRFQFDENGYPMMYIFSNCKATIRTLPLLQYDEHKVEDLDTEGEDHIADEIRYFLMSRPIKPKHEEIADKYNETPQAMFLDIKKEDLTPQRPFKRMEVQRIG